MVRRGRRRGGRSVGREKGDYHDEEHQGNNPQACVDMAQIAQLITNTVG